MKQRLLLALLVLFASVGTTWGAGTGTLKLNVAKGGSLTVSFSAKTTFTPDGGTEQSTTSFQITSNDTKTVAVERTLTIADLEITTSNGVITPTPRTITITGSNVTGVTINGDFMTALDIRNVGLTDFSISNATNLTSLAIGDNKLPIDKIPAKGSYTSYKVGTQTPDLSNYGLSEAHQKPANQALDLTIGMLLTDNSTSSASLLSSSSTPSIVNESAYTIQGWKYKAANATSYSGTSYPHSDASAPNRYYFYSGSTTYVDGNEWMHGDYTCDIKIAETSSNFPGVIISGIPVTVKAAQYALTAPEIYVGTQKNSDAGSVTVLKDDQLVSNYTGAKISKSEKLTLKPIANTGYTFSKFEAKGYTVKSVSNSNGLYEAEVTGKTKDEVSLSAIFTRNTQTITIQTPTNGTINVYDGTTEIKDGGSVAYGKTIKIHTTPNDGYQVDKVQVNGGTALSEPEVKGKTSIYSYTIASTEAIIITAAFKQNTDSKLTLKWVDGDINYISLDGDEGNSTVDSEISSMKTKTYTVAFDTKPAIKIQTKPGKYLTSIVASDDSEVKYTVVEKENGSNGTTYLISDFKMPNHALTFVINTGEKNEALIIVDAAASAETRAASPTYDYSGELVFDDTEKKISYTTSPSGLSGVVVEYNTQIGSELNYSTASFKNAGTYKVRLSRAADESYSAAKVVLASNHATEIEDGTLYFTIEEATPIVVTEPTVKINQTTGAYEFTSKGSVAYMRGSSKITIDSKYYSWKVVTVSGENYTDKVKSDDSNKNNAGNYKSELVTVLLNIKKDANADYDNNNNSDGNFVQDIPVAVTAQGEGSVAQVDLAVYSGLPAGTSLTFMNGTKDLGKTAKVPVRSTFYVKVSAPGWTDLKVAQVDNQGNAILGSDGQAITEDVEEDDVAEFTASGTKMIFTITGTAPKALQELVLDSAEDDGTVDAVSGVNSNTYDGKVKFFNTEKIKVKNKATGALITTSLDWSKATITYKDPNGVATTSPVNAGVYTVTITRPADEPTSTSGQVSYKAFTATGKLIIHQAGPTIINWPNQSDTDAAKIGKGQPLSSAVLTGGVANVEGTFEWVSPTEVVNVDGQYDVKFVSKDTNYKNVVCPASKKAYVKISNESILSIASDDTYTITVKGSDGKEYKSGQTVPVGITLTFTVNPAATYKLKALYVNGVAISGNTYKTTAGPIAVKAEMEQEFTVSVSTSVKGIELVLPSSNVVKKGASYSFSVKGLAADLANLVVSDGTNIYTGTNGAYTISNITANKTITVTMKAGTAPTQVEAVIEANLSTQGKSMGTVTVTKISSLRADAVDSSTQKFYYGDKIRVTATPAAGCRFVGWEGRTETISVIDVVITETSYKFKAIFAGSPTGAEVIEGVDIYGSNGEIVVKCDGAARITIVSMNGQSKQQEISGDTRIPAGAGIYGIVFEQGNNVMRTKVAVK